MLYTWGCSNRKLADLVDTVRRCNILIVVDVRTNPEKKHSHQSDFSGAAMRTILAIDHKIKCIWVPALGNLNGSHVDVRLAEQETGFNQLSQLLKEYGNVLLLGSERNPDWCHRSYISRKMQERYLVPVVHL